jgi:hypothetical protein
MQDLVGGSFILQFLCNYETVNRTQSVTQECAHLATCPLRICCSWSALPQSNETNIFSSLSNRRYSLGTLRHTPHTYPNTKWTILRQKRCPYLWTFRMTYQCLIEHTTVCMSAVVQLYDYKVSINSFSSSSVGSHHLNFKPYYPALHYCTAAHAYFR